jgi:hypothetical protein
MLTLHDLQAGVGLAMLGGDASAAAAAIHDDGLSADARLAIYRHHVVTSLTAALESTYPVVARLVDPRFFRYAAHRFIRDHPPVGPCLFEYGAALPDFLASFRACRDLAYLPDVARLEWAMNRALHAPDAMPVEPNALRSLPPVALHPSVTLLRSPWPIDAVWRANQPEMEGTMVDLGSGVVRLQIWRADDEVVFRGLSPANFAFRESLGLGHGLEAAAQAARRVDTHTDLAVLVAGLLDERVLVPAERLSLV